MMQSKDFTYFLTVIEYGEMGLEIGETCLYYHLDETQLQVLCNFRVGQYYKSHFSDDMTVQAIALEYKPENIKNSLGTFLIEYIASPFVRNYPHFVKSDLFTREEYDQLYEISLMSIIRQKELAKLNINELTEICRRYRLNPEPVNQDGTSWQANCPSGGHHWIMVAGDSWGCGYCKKQGGVEELVTWLEQVERKHI